MHYAFDGYDRPWHDLHHVTAAETKGNCTTIVFIAFIVYYVLYVNVLINESQSVSQSDGRKSSTQLVTTPWVKKTRHQTLAHNVTKY